MEWKFTCKELPPLYTRVVIWFSLEPGTTPNDWTEAYVDSAKYFYSDRLGVYIPISNVSHWFIPTPPASYCGGQEGDGGPLE